MSAKNMELEALKEAIHEIIDRHYCLNGDNGIECYVDYRDKELSNNTLHSIMIDDNPREVFNEMISEWAFDYANNVFPDVFRTIESDLYKKELEIYETYEDEIKEWVYDTYYFYYDENEFNNEVKVNIMLDTGDMNYDFTRNNILNYYASAWYNNKGYIPDESPILWLAKQMKKATKLREACIKQYIGEDYESDSFIKSVIDELKEATCHMTSLTFLVKMKLFDYFTLIEAIKKEKPLNKSYIFEDRTGIGYIIVSKDTMCGLFNPWGGGGSLLGIELDKDLKIPFKCIWAAEIETGKSNYGYSVNSVYGLIDSAWNGRVKEIHEMKGV